MDIRIFAWCINSLVYLLCFLSTTSPSLKTKAKVLPLYFFGCNVIILSNALPHLHFFFPLDACYALTWLTYHLLFTFESGSARFNIGDYIFLASKTFERLSLFREHKTFPLVRKFFPTHFASKMLSLALDYPWYFPTILLFVHYA